MKRESRVPKRLMDEYQPSSQGRKKAKCSKDNKLYEVEIVEVDKEKKKVKIHFKGYGHETDEWRDYDEDNVPFQRLEKVYNPDEDSLEERMNIFHGQLYRNIKRKLWSSRREDPDVRIEVNVDTDVFNAGLGQVVK